MRKKIANKTKEKAVNDYFNGKTVKDICKRYKVKKTAVYDWIKDSRQSVKKDTGDGNGERLRVVSLYLKGTSVKSLSHKFKLKTSTIYYWISKYQNKILENLLLSLNKEK